MNASLSNASPSSQGMTPEFIEPLAELHQLKAALAELPKGRRAQNRKS
jgi:hypothetical protein